jgi:hypothetical protein
VDLIGVIPHPKGAMGRVNLLAYTTPYQPRQQRPSLRPNIPGRWGLDRFKA